MAGAETSDSTLPPQCGHFFRCGPATLSIFSVSRPHFRHLYSYRGKDSLLLGHRTEKYITRRHTLRLGARLLTCLANVYRATSPIHGPRQTRSHRQDASISSEPPSATWKTLPFAPSAFSKKLT